MQQLSETRDIHEQSQNKPRTNSNPTFRKVKNYTCKITVSTLFITNRILFQGSTQIPLNLKQIQAITSTITSNLT